MGTRTWGAPAAHNKMNNKNNLLTKLKALLTNLRHTPIHPQWLVYRQEKTTRHMIKTHIYGKVLDIGCGDRWVERTIEKPNDYFGLDYPGTVNLGYRGTPSIFGDGQCLPFADQSFDCVTLLDVLEHMPAPYSAVAEAWRVLKVDGVILIQVPFLYPLHDEPFDFQRWTRYGLQKVCTASGFEVLQFSAVSHPVSTATSLLSIALTKSLLDGIAAKRLAIAVFAPIILALIPLANICGWLISQWLPSSEIMPLSYILLAKKKI